MARPMQRVVRRARFTGRAALGPASFSTASGFGLQALLEVRNCWLPAAFGAALAMGALTCLVAAEAWAGRRGRRWDVPFEPDGKSTAAVLERSSTAQQFAHAFGTAAMVLIGLSAGLCAGALAGF